MLEIVTQVSYKLKIKDMNKKDFIDSVEWYLKNRNRYSDSSPKLLADDFIKSMKSAQGENSNVSDNVANEKFCIGEIHHTCKHFSEITGCRDCKVHKFTYQDKTNLR